MPRALIPLYVLLTTRLPVPWGLLARATGVLLGYMAATRLAPDLALNIAVGLGLAGTLWVRLPQTWFDGETRDQSTGVIIVTISLSLIATALILPPQALQIAISAGLFVMAAAYFSIWKLDPDMLDLLGWDVKLWGVEGRANAARWQVARCAGLGVANAYTSVNLAHSEWIVTHAALPLIFYMLYHWTVIATHPLNDA